MRAYLGACLVIQGMCGSSHLSLPCLCFLPAMLLVAAVQHALPHRANAPWAPTGKQGSYLHQQPQQVGLSSFCNTLKHSNAGKQHHNRLWTQEQPGIAGHATLHRQP